jgi:hypothetical protein
LPPRRMQTPPRCCRTEGEQGFNQQCQAEVLT